MRHRSRVATVQKALASLKDEDDLRITAEWTAQNQK